MDNIEIHETEDYKNIYNIMKQIDNIEISYGIYGLLIDGTCVYVGQSIKLHQRMCEHFYYIMHPDEGDNKPLYKMLNYAAYKKNREVSFALIEFTEGKWEYTPKINWLKEIEAQVIQTRLPMFNRVIPDCYGKPIQYRQVELGDDMNLFFNPMFIERKKCIKVDRDYDFGYIYNKHYDELFSNNPYLLIKFDKNLFITQQND